MNASRHPSPEDMTALCSTNKDVGITTARSASQHQKTSKKTSKKATKKATKKAATKFATNAPGKPAEKLSEKVAGKQPWKPAQVLRLAEMPYNKQKGQPHSPMPVALPHTQPTPQALLSPLEALQLDNKVHVVPSSRHTHRNVILDDANQILSIGKIFLDALRETLRVEWGMKSGPRATRPWEDTLATRMSQLTTMARSMEVSLQALSQMDDGHDSYDSNGGDCSVQRGNKKAKKTKQN